MSNPEMSSYNPDIPQQEVADQIVSDPEQIKSEVESRTPEVVSYTKEHDREGRTEIAANIKSVRAEYYSRVKDVSQEIEKTGQLSTELETQKEQILTEIKAIKEALTDNEGTVSSKIVHYFTNKNLRSTAEEKRSSAEGLVQELQRVQEQLESFQLIRKNRQEIDQAAEILGKYWDEKSVNWHEYQEDKRDSEIANIAKKFDVLMVHAINPAFAPGTNSLVKEGTSWQEKLNIVLSLSPSLACSTFKHGDSHHNLWAQIGVFLKGGKVVDADTRDSGSIAQELGNRVINRGLYSTKERIGNVIQHAIDNRDEGGYNELIVNEPEVAGFFWCLDATNNVYEAENQRSMSAPIAEVIATTRALNLPLYLIRDGKTFLAETDDAGEIVSESPVTFEHPIDSSFKLEEEQKQFLVNELMANLPFKAEHMFDFQAIQAVESGAIIFYALNNQSTHFKNDFSLKNPDMGGTQIQDTVASKGAMKLYQPVLGNDTTYFLCDNIVWVEMGVIGTDERQRNTKVQPVFNPGRDTEVPGYLLRGSESSKISTNEEYIATLVQKIQEHRDHIPEIQAMTQYPESTRNSWVKDSELRIAQFCFSLYGFAREADKCGLNDLATQALAVIEQYSSTDQLSETIQKRITPEGTFRMEIDEISS